MCVWVFDWLCCGELRKDILSRETSAEYWLIFHNCCEAESVQMSDLCICMFRQNAQSLFIKSFREVWVEWYRVRALVAMLTRTQGSSAYLLSPTYKYRGLEKYDTTYSQ